MNPPENDAQSRTSRYSSVEEGIESKSLSKVCVKATAAESCTESGSTSGNRHTPEASHFFTNLVENCLELKRITKEYQARTQAQLVHDCINGSRCFHRL